MPTNDEGQATNSRTYSALPQHEEIDIEKENGNDEWNRSTNKRQVKDPNANLVSQLVDSQPQSWPAT